MRDADIQVVDSSPDDPFDFSLDDYFEQLVAGTTRNLSDRGLLARVPDFDKLPGNGAAEAATR